MPRTSAQPPVNRTSQSSLLDVPPVAGSNLPEFTVSEMSKALKKMVEDTFGLVRVRGEISECKYHSSGHVYITLKDENAVLASVCWKGQISKLSVRPELGMDVVCTGRLTTYAGQSKYQLVIDGMALAGMGALLKMLEDRKKKLAAEGLFDTDRKRSLPFLPTTIGVITSPTGAVIRDILHRLSDRFPRHVLVWPVAVQGEASASQIVAAIEGFNRLSASDSLSRPDILIVARGGGSVEDLMSFNDESVVRAAAKSTIPIISAVGHETDTTLIDFVADRRAPTPTAAAEMAVPVRDQLMAQILDDGARLELSVRRHITDRRDRILLIARALGDPLRAIEPLIQKLDDKIQRLGYCWQSYEERLFARLNEAKNLLRHPRDILQFATYKLQNDLQKLESLWRENLMRKSNRLETVGAVLGHLSPRSVLGRGYVLVESLDGHVLTSRHDVKAGASIRIEFHDGRVQGTITKESAD